MPELQQVSFAGGEIAPEMRGRVDIAKYLSGLSLSRNIIHQAQGGCLNRPGFRLAAPSLLTYAASTLQPELVDFADVNGNSYMLEFGDSTMRIFSRGNLVVYPVGHPQAGQVVVISTPYNTAELQRLKWEQSNDVVTFTTGNGDRPYEMRRLDNHIWTFTLLDFVPPINPPTGVAANATMAYEPDVDNDPTPHTYAVTSLDSSGRESRASARVTCNNLLGYNNNWNTITWSAQTGADRYRVYKFKNGSYGFLGSTELLTFRDDNIAPDFSQGVPEAAPFVNTSTFDPGVTTFYQNRRIFGATTDRPVGVYGTRSSDLYSMDITTPTQDDDAFLIPMTSTQRQKVLNMVALDELIVFTQTGEFYITGDSDVITPASYARQISRYGSSPVTPIQVGASIMFVQRAGRRLLEMAFQKDTGYTNADKTIFVPHFFRDRVIVGSCYAETPYSVIWCWCDDGTAFAFTFLPEHDVWAWSQMETDGFVERMNTVEEDDENRVYASIVRSGVRYIERMARREFANTADGFFVDCGVTYTGAPAKVISGLSHLEGRTVAILADANVVVPQVVTGGQITLPFAASTVHIGLPYSARIQTLELQAGAEVVQGRIKTLSHIRAQFLDSRGMKVGSSFDSLYTVRNRDYEALSDPATTWTGWEKVTAEANWEDGARVCVQQDLPLPLNLLSVVPNIVFQ